MDAGHREFSTVDAARASQVDDRAVKREQVSESATTRAMLFPQDEADRLKSEWINVQGGFVDEPRRAVERADQLVEATMKRIAEVFGRERVNLEQQWDRGDHVTTEDLRVALQRYRAFFDRLLSL
jgi:hypothetical protein